MEENAAAIAARQIAILATCWLFAAASGLTWAITERRYRDICSLFALGCYSGFVGLSGALAVFVWAGVSYNSEPLALLIATFLGLLGKSVDEYRGKIVALLLKKIGIEPKNER